MIADIETERLILKLLDETALAALAAGNLMSLEWNDIVPLAKMRLGQLREDRFYAPWSLRAIVLRATGEAVGYVNFHGRPALHELAQRPACAEFGYTIFPQHRRRGYAEETVRALMGWAMANGAENFIFSIAPDNTPSRSLALKLGARKVGTQIDEEDGPEDVHLLEPVKG
ncbi:MAG: GNAT family N-acetyltransferase [Parvibaculaceae bacterium]